MTNTGGQNWSSAIPHQSSGKKVYYYIYTKTGNGKYFSKPITAPLGNLQFYVLGTTGITGNTGEIPGKFKLYQNFPNPFNPSTRIKFDLPLSQGIEKQAVRLTVYNVLGEEIRTIVNSELKPGTYEYDLTHQAYPAAYISIQWYPAALRIRKK